MTYQKTELWRHSAVQRPRVWTTFAFRSKLLEWICGRELIYHWDGRKNVPVSFVDAACCLVKWSYYIFIYFLGDYSLSQGNGKVHNVQGNDMVMHCMPSKLNLNPYPISSWM